MGKSLAGQEISQNDEKWREATRAEMPYVRFPPLVSG